MDWKSRLSESTTTIEEMEQRIPLSGEERRLLGEIASIHPVRVTRHVMNLIDPEDPKDPIRKMYLPSVDELDLSGSYDTSGEAENTKALGLQHKYGPTVLLLSTNACAIYCRYCFRKRLVGLTNDEVLRHFDDAAEYITEHPEVNNVLISGGDSFMLETPTLLRMLHRLSAIPHLRFIRFGTKTPVSLPSRIIGDRRLLDAFAEQNGDAAKPRIYVFTHVNHPREIGSESRLAVRRLNEAGVTVSCQSVLLRGVNDDANVLVDLMNGLVSAGIVPYYLFQCRPVSRVRKSFQIPILRGIEILEQAQMRLPGPAKRFKYAMSHRVGKIEILGRSGSNGLFRLHEARDAELTGRIFIRPLGSRDGWLPDDLDPGLDV